MTFFMNIFDILNYDFFREISRHAKLTFSVKLFDIKLTFFHEIFRHTKLTFVKIFDIFYYDFFRQIF